MKGLRLLLFVTCLLLSGQVYSKKNKNTKNVMNSVLKSFVTLIPYMTSESKFNDPKNEPLIEENLRVLSKAFEENSHLNGQFLPNAILAKEHLEETLETFRLKNKVFARTRLKATSRLCINCHTQISNKAFKKITTVKNEDFGSHMEYADFLFVLRDFHKAEREYLKEIDERSKLNSELMKKNKLSHLNYLDFSIEKSIKRILSLYTAIEYNKSKIDAFLSSINENDKLPKRIRDQASEQKEQHLEYSKLKPAVVVRNHKEFEKYVKLVLLPLEEKSLGDGSYDVHLLIAHGVLSKYLNANPKSKDMGEVFYWMAKIDYTLNNNYLFNLSEIYLKQCMKNYAKGSIAKKCYKLYEEHITDGYTGSSGVNIPKDEKRELEKYKKLISN